MYIIHTYMYIYIYIIVGVGSEVLWEILVNDITIDEVDAISSFAVCGSYLQEPKSFKSLSPEPETLNP